MQRALWKDAVLAESEHTEVVEGNHYFPPNSINRTYFNDSETTTECGWKGTAHYYHIRVDDEVNEDAAWHYPSPKADAENIAGHVAFWKGVHVEA